MGPRPASMAWLVGGAGVGVVAIVVTGTADPGVPGTVELVSPAVIIEGEAGAMLSRVRRPESVPTPIARRTATEASVAAPTSAAFRLRRAAALVTIAWTTFGES